MDTKLINHDGTVYPNKIGEMQLILVMSKINNSS